MRSIVAASLFLALSSCEYALAHGDGSTLMGSITAVSSDELTVRASDGDVVQVPVDAKTTYRRGAEAAGASDVTVGMRVVIDVEAAEGSVAKSARLPATSAAAAATGSHGVGEERQEGHHHEEDTRNHEEHAHPAAQ